MSISPIKIGIYTTLIILFLILLIILLIPKLLSTSQGSAYLMHQINRKIPGKIDVGNIKLGWFTDQQIENFKLQTPEGETILFIESLKMNEPLMQSLLKGFSHSSFGIKNLEGLIVRGSNGETNFERALGGQVKHSIPLPLNKPIILEKVQLDLNYLQKGQFTLKGSGVTREGNLEGHFSIDADLGEVQKIDLTAVNLPVLILDQLIAFQKPKYSGLLTNLFGDSIDLKIKQIQEETKNELFLEGRSPQISLNLQGSFLDQELKVDQGNIQFNIPQVNSQNLLKNSNIPIVLSSPIQGEMQLQNLTFSQSEFENIEKLKLQMLPFTFAAKNQPEKEIQLNSLNLSFDHKKVNIQMQGQDLGKPLFVDANILLHDFSTFEFMGKMNGFPTELFCYFPTFDLSLCKKIEALIGPKVDGQIDFYSHNFEGPISLNASGENGSLSFQGELKKGFLTLKTPLQGFLKVTPQLENLVLKEMLPFVRGVLQANEPIQYFFDPKGFSAPIKDFSLNRLTISQGMLDLHKITFSRASQMGKIANLLGIKANQFEIWFTPLYFNMQQGKITLSRMDMLINNSYPLAIWGNIDLLKDSLNLSLGLSGTALSKAFGVKLDKDYMLSIPLFGSVSNPQIETAKMTARISSLIAKLRGGEKETFLGNFLEAATGALTGDKVPKPTTVPFPWEKQLQEEQNNPPSAPLNEQIEKMDLNPAPEIKKELKELKKEAKKFLKGFFK